MKQQFPRHWMSAIRTLISEAREAVRGPAHWVRVQQPQGTEGTNKLRRWGRRGSWDPRSDSQDRAPQELQRPAGGFPQVCSRALINKCVCQEPSKPGKELPKSIQKHSWEPSRAGIVPVSTSQTGKTHDSWDCQIQRVLFQDNQQGPFCIAQQALALLHGSEDGRGVRENGYMFACG